MQEGPDTAAEREAGYQRFVENNLRRNYAGHFMHGMIGVTGFRLVNAPTFVPAYLHLLSGSDVIVGLGLALQQLGGVFSSILGATHIEHRKRIVPVTALLGGLMRLQVLGLALSGLFLHGAVQLAAALIFLFLFGVFSGPQGVAFQFLLAKMIPIRLRGRLQGWRNVTGGLIAAALSWVAGKYLVATNIWGDGYAATFLAAFGFTCLSLIFFLALVREPVPPTVRPRMAIRDRMRDFVPMMRDEPDFGWFMVARTFAIANRIAAPFYIVYAAKTLGMTGETVGTLTFAYLIAATVTNIGWGYMADGFGFRSVLIAALFLLIAATGLLMAASGLWLIFAAFFGLGAANAGYQMSAQNIVFEFGHRDDTAMRLALSNTAESLMSAIGPLAGGVIAAGFGYETVFGVSIACQAVALVLLFARVPEPRNRVPADATVIAAEAGVSDEQEG